MTFAAVKHIINDFRGSSSISDACNAEIHRFQFTQRTETPRKKNTLMRSRIHHLLLFLIVIAGGASELSSDPVQTTATIHLKLPIAVEVSRIRHYSQYCERYQQAVSFSCATPDPGSLVRTLPSGKLQGFHGDLSFSVTECQNWQLELPPDESTMAVVRKLRFYSGETEVFPQRLWFVEYYRRPRFAPLGHSANA